MSSCDQFREMYEAYALGALDAAELSAFEAHLASRCATCAEGVAEARWLVSQLAYTASDSGPSDMLKGRLMQTVRAEAAKSAPSSSSQRVGTRSATVPYWLSAGIAALLLITLYTAWDAHRAKEELRATNERIAENARKEQEAADQKIAAMTEQIAAMRRENAILTDPAATKIMLMPQKIAAPELVAMWQHENGIVVTGRKVPMPSANHVLQLWLIPKDPGAKPMPSMALRPDESGKFVMVVAHPPDPSGIKALAITEEPEGGSLQPTSAIRWVGAMT